MPQKLGGKGGLIFPDSTGFHVHAGDAQFLQNGELIRVNVLHYRIDIGVCINRQIQLVSQTHNEPGFVISVLIADVIGFAQQLVQVFRAHIGVPFTAQQKTLIVVKLVGAQFFRGVGIGLSHGQGKTFIIFDTVLQAGLRQGEQITVGVAGIVQYKALQRNIIGSPVADEHVAMTVKHFTTGGRDVLGVGGGIGTVVGSVFILAKLHGKQPYTIYKGNKQNKKNHNAVAEAISSIHGILQSGRCTGLRDKKQRKKSGRSDTWAGNC